MFPAHQGVRDTRGDRVGDGYRRSAQIMLCPACAAGRGATLMLYVYFFVAVVIGAIAVSALAKLAF